MPVELSERQRRLLDAVLILGVVALGFVVAGFASALFYAFFDILLLFFLAWLLSFALAPLINGVHRLVPRIPQAGAVIIVYLTIVAILLAVLVQASASLALVYPAVHPGRSEPPGPADQSPDGDPGPAGRVRVLRGPCRPGADHRQEPTGLGRSAGRPAPIGRGREHRSVRQHPHPGHPVDLHRGRPRGHRRLPVPPGPARGRERGAACSRRASPARSMASSRRS